MDDFDGLLDSPTDFDEYIMNEDDCAPDEEYVCDEPEDQFRNDVEADADTLASAGWGTDEDYGYYGDE